MLSSVEYIRQSLETHLFFARIMKEHSFFLQVGFTPPNNDFTERADDLRKRFDRFLEEVVSVANGNVSNSVLKSGEVVTPYTLKAEAVSSKFTGVKIPTQLTQKELGLKGGSQVLFSPFLWQRVHTLNQTAVTLITNLIRLKSEVLSNVLSCKMFTVNYPLLIDHILREARHYLEMVQGLQSGNSIDGTKIAREEAFWNRIMGEHAKFIRGLLDPSEDALIDRASAFANQFDRLTAEAKTAENITVKSFKATEAIRDFKRQGTEGILDCKVKSVILPLLADHTLREANHYLRILKPFQK